MNHTRTDVRRRVVSAANDVDIVVPVYNEVDQLAHSVRRLRRFLDDSFPFRADVVIADNASTDGTWDAARQLARQHPGVRALHLDGKGRGLALKAAWSASTAPVVAYMDVDLSTGLEALLPLVAPLLSGHSDIATGSRLVPGSRVVRGTKRELISRGYNHLLRLALGASFRDAQCGFKAVRREIADRLLPEVEDDGWFFDTELLVLAQRTGLRIHEVPVDWRDDPDSRVDIVRTALADFRGVWRLRSRRRARNGPAAPTGGQPTAEQLLRLSGAGALPAFVYVVGFWALRGWLGPLPASAIAMALCSLRHATVTARSGPAGFLAGGQGAGRRLSAVGIAVLVNVGTTTAALALVSSSGRAGLLTEMAVAGATSMVGALVTFALLRSWLYRPNLGTAEEAVAGGGSCRHQLRSSGGRPAPLLSMPRSHS